MGVAWRPHLLVEARAEGLLDHFPLHPGGLVHVGEEACLDVQVWGVGGALWWGLGRRLCACSRNGEEVMCMQ